MAKSWAGMSWEAVNELCGVRVNKIGWNRIERCVRRGVPLQFEKNGGYGPYCTFCGYGKEGHQQAQRLMIHLVK